MFPVQPFDIVYILNPWHGILEIFFHKQSFNVVVMCYQSKFQKHQAFEAEVSANQERVLETINLAEGE